MSSYLNNFFKDDRRKKIFLDQKHEDVIFSLVHDNNAYKIYSFIQPQVSNLEWLETKGQWKACDKILWNEFKISKSMSDQFWMYLSIDHWNNWGIKIYDL